MPKSKLETRLTRQLAAEGKKDAAGMAHALLLQRGHITADGSLTKAGAERDALGNDGRAKDRAAKYSGGAHKTSDYTYDAKTNMAKLKSKK